MPDTGPAPEYELILRRLSDPFPIGPAEYSSALWFVAIGAVLLLGFAFVIWMYRRDSRSCRWYWATPLAILRMSVYSILALAFLLPAVQQWETAEKRSRVLVLLDVSPSVIETSDDLAANSAVKPKMRMEKVIDLLTDEQIGLMKKLLEKNPVFVYRFGTRLDEESQGFEKGTANWDKDRWQAWTHYDLRPWAKEWMTRALSEAGLAAMSGTEAWKIELPANSGELLAWVKQLETQSLAVAPEADKKQIVENRTKMEKRFDVAQSIVLGTNVPEPITAAINREASNLAQGIVVFSDGRSNLGSDTAYQTLRDRATREKIPVFTVAVGEARENISISLTDVQAPDRAPPDEQFKVIVEADGVGLADAEVEVTLDLFLPGRDAKKDAADHQIMLPVKFLGNTQPPHGTVEFLLDPAKLPETLTEPSKKLGVQRQLKQGEWSVVARIPRDKRELFPDPEHLSPIRTIQVLDKPLRVLMFAGAATREYQTLKRLLVNETKAKRAELSICLQMDSAREGTAVQDVPPERMLTKFPTRLDLEASPSQKPEEKYYNLNEYDLIIAFDPDWSELSPDQVKNLQTWVDNLGGGFIFVAGPINTFQLARADETGHLKPVLDILPVVPEDIILVRTRPVPRTPHRLILRPNPEYDVLKLTDDSKTDPAAGWEEYFTGQEKTPPTADPRYATPNDGFYTYYPVKGTKPGASTLADFVDRSETGEPALRPWLVTTQAARGRSVFLASGEIWRLQAANLDFYDRFWVKLSRYAASNRDAKTSRGRLLLGKEFNSGSQIRVQARILSPNGLAYEENAISPKFVISQFNSDGSKKIAVHGPFELRPKKSGNTFDGYYAGQVLADSSRFPPGDSLYRVTVDVPDSVGDTLTGEFLMKKSDPELDNVRPDFVAMEQLAGTLQEVSAKIRNPETLETLRGGERDASKVKLAYRLDETRKLSLIPECIDEVVQSFRNRGAVEDLWDKPLRVPLGNGQELRLIEFETGERLSWLGIGPQKISISFLLLLGVGLLSLEWLVRKLLRLA